MTSPRAHIIGTLLVATLALAGCGDDDGSTRADPGVTTTAAPGSDAIEDPGGGGVGDGGRTGGTSLATIDLVIIGGPDEGDHRAESTGYGCSRDPLGEGTFGLQYSLDDRDGFHSLQILVHDAQAATRGGTDDFVATATIDANRYHLDRGAGSLTVDDRGDSAVITFFGTTADGAEMSASVQCHRLGT